MNLQHYRESVNNFGLLRTLYHAAYRAANRMTRVAVWNAIAITPDKLNPAFRPDASLDWQLLSADEMRRQSSNVDVPLTADFIDEAAAKGDRCLALFENGNLTSYGWYSVQPTRLNEIADELELHFDPSYVYMYNGYTLPEFRGRRLHALGMAAALDAHARENRRGLISYVDSSNYASLKSCRRMGYFSVGRIVVLRVGTQYVSRVTPGCRPYGLRVEPIASSTGP